MKFLSKTAFASVAASFVLAATPVLAQQQQQGGQQGMDGRQQQMQAQQSQQQQMQQDQRQQARIPSQFTREAGRIVMVRPVRVRGVETPNYIAVIETPDRRRLVADLGQNVRNMDLRRGAPIQLRGEVVRVGPRRAVLLADTVRVAGRTFELDRPAMAMVMRPGGLGMTGR